MILIFFIDFELGKISKKHLYIALFMYIIIAVIDEMP